jgi:hypothetical protein
MTDTNTNTNKLENWAFPFKTAGASAEVSDPQLYYDALAKANGGFYPMGANGLWHGGVHFDAGTGALLEQSSVRCIADGEVIAYRIDERYPKTQYGNDPEDTRPFSTGFVLVKHRLELPALPTTAAATPASTAPAAEALTFYSLYMHLRDWAGYRACPTPEVPDFIGEKTYSVKPDKAVDAVKGLKVRAGPKPPAGTPASVEYTTELALLPKGCKIKVGDPASATSQWHKLESILQGAALPALSETQGWVYVLELEATPEPNIYLVGAKANDSNTSLAPQKGLNVRSADKASLLGLLPVGAKFKIAPGTGDYRELKEITEGMDIAPLKANSVGNILGYVHWASLQANLIDPPFDQVVPLNPTISIKAGELIGHLGQYQNHNEAAQTLVHLEVFSCEDVPSFITKSRARASSLPDSDKTLIRVDKHSTIFQPSAADGLIASGMDVRLCSDSPKQGCWAKVQRYAVFKANKISELGTYSGGKYPLNASQKTILAARLGVEVTQMPDTLDFLNEIYTADGSEPLPYSAPAPATHPMRKVGAVIGAPLWVESNQLSPANQRNSTDGALPAWSQFPLQSTSDGISSGYERILPGASWDGLPHARKAIDDTPTRWWYVTVGDINGNDISGWAPEKDLIVTRHSPWEWPGFSTIMETATPADLHARALHANGQLTTSEVPNYKARIDTADQGVLLKELYKIIDVPDRTGQRDGLLSASELKAALAKPWLAQQLSLLISHYESEWFWSKEKWDALDPLMAPPPAAPNTYWVAEKARIEKLSWWAQAAGQHGIKTDGMAWHFHVAGLIGGFNIGCPEKCKTEVYEIETTVGIFVVSKKLFEYILDIERYSEYPYALSDNSSGITIAYGYDLGQQTSTTVDTELAGLYAPGEIEILKTSLGKKGAEARAHLATVRHIAINKDNALKLAVIMKKRYAQQVVDIYPEVINLHPDCQGALLSLVINRGNALSGTTPAKTAARLEMKQIQEDFINDKIEMIPSRLRDMTRLWRDDSTRRGVAIRREKEADFFEDALTCKCWK